MDWTNRVQDAREQHLDELADAGFERYPSTTNRDAPITGFVSQYEDTDDDFESTDEWVLAGRVTRINDFGDIYFIDIEDETGTVQVQFDSDHTEELTHLESVDTGDIIEADGYAIRSNTGELTLHARSYRVLAKALSSPPAREGFTEEERVRQRSLALQYDDELHQSVRTRFEMTEVIRDFLTDNDYLEVETPMLQNVYGGGSAHPFETYCAGLDEDVYLRIAPEIALKKMVIGGFENIFEIGKVFRNEDIDTTHNPEFTMLELYEAYADYEDMMVLTEELVSAVVSEVTGSTTIEYDGVELDFSTPWTRRTVADAVTEYSPIEVASLSGDELVDAAKTHAPEELAAETEADAVMALYEAFVEDELTQPTFIIDHPSGSSPLCKTHRDDDSVQERFEVIVNGMELANSYSERNDPSKQADAFQQQADQYDEDAEHHHQVDTSYLESLASGMPPTGGLGIGIDRLAMLVTDSQSIKEVLAFPMVSQHRSSDTGAQE